MKKYDFAIITPCYNENKTVIEFLNELAATIQDLEFNFLILIVNDCSTDETQSLLSAYKVGNQNVKFIPIHLKNNVGHQRAILQGLLFTKGYDVTNLIVMDSDGEDNPAAIPELVKLKDQEIVLVARGRRKESLFFKIGYFFYQWAGIGINTKLLAENGQQIEKITSIEPDSELAKEIKANVRETNKEVIVKDVYLKDLDRSELYDSILYIDVIEHIEDDLAEIELAKIYLKKGGHLIILVPAHNYLFSPFDKAIGHFRRYNKGMLKSLMSDDMKRKKLVYLDSLGLLASLTNKFFLKQKYPTQKQILKWDRMIIPPSKITDRILFYSN